MITYTQAQIDAINTLDKNLQIIACAGSGKTQVISQRVVNILKEKPEIHPANIIAFTYTEKAAAELKTRILRLCKEQLGDVPGLAEMYIGTIHAWCLRALQDHVYEFQKYNVLDEIKLKLFVDRYFKFIGMQDLGMEWGKDTSRFVALMGIMREAELAPGKQYPADLLAALQQYEETLRQHCYFDFTMVMTETVERLEQDEGFRERLGKTLRYLIVDEYQDVNPVQEHLIERLVGLGANVCVVGDDDQTIYQWRGSDIRAIQHFCKKYPNVEYIKLEDNFRSTSGVVATAVKSIGHNVQRLPKAMNAAGHQKYERGDILYNQYANEAEENAFIVNTISHLRGVAFQDSPDAEIRGLDYADMVVLLRTWKKARIIMAALSEADIPFIVTGVNELFERPEAKAARAIFEYLKGEIGPDAFIDYWMAVTPALNEEAINRGIWALAEHDPMSGVYYAHFSLQEAFWSFLEATGIREELFRDPTQPVIAGNHPEEIIFYNLGMFSRMIDDYETINFKTEPKYQIGNFLNFMRYAAEGYYPEGWLENTYKTPNAVRIMTIHQSKGLEFPVVFLPGLNRNYIPLKKPGGKQVWHHLDKEIIKDQQRYEGTVEDERRLFYVAITRSQKYLFLSRAPEWNGEKNKPNKLYQHETIFCKEVAHSPYLFTSKDRDYSERARSVPCPRIENQTLLLNFSILRNFFDCPYRFKMVSMYRFVQPLAVEMGFGKAIHNMLMEIHRRVLDNEEMTPAQIPHLLKTHLYLPYADKKIQDAAERRAGKMLEDYFDLNQQDFDKIAFAEKDIQIDIGAGIMVNGRMDLIKRENLDGTVETTIVDFKSSQDAQSRDLTMEQLSLYALGYQDLTGDKADFLQIYNLDEELPHPDKQELTYKDLNATRERIINAAKDIRGNHLAKTCDATKCATCYHKRLCSGVIQNG
ncbi:ATP-dependent helicase [Acidithiobacillus sp.]